VRFTIRTLLNVRFDIIKNHPNAINYDVPDNKEQEKFHLRTTKHQYCCRYIISATWEFNFPAHGNITGIEYAKHSSEIRDYSLFEDTETAVPIIGWYESSVDAAYTLSKKGIKSHL